MNLITRKCKAASLMAALLLVSATGALATIDGITASTFNLTAKEDHISTADGGSVLLWGFANGTGRAQYPGPTLIVQQNAVITINLRNDLTVPVSIVFPGQEGVASPACGSPGLLACQAAAGGGTVTYTFVARNPGTYLYYSGTNPELQVEMGLVGALIVRPSMGPSYAYNHLGTQFDLEYLFLLSEMDPRVHQAVEFHGPASAQALAYLADRQPNYWFINGRTAMDTLQAPAAGWLPTQPYNSLPLTRPGDRVLIRLIGGGQDQHPFHTHGDHARLIARDGRLEESAPGMGPDLSHERFTLQSIPGETIDAIFDWTGKDLGWDIYGTAVAHTCNGKAVNDPIPGSAGFDPITKEYCPDHGKPFPVTLPETQFTLVGPFYSGSPFMGSAGALPPGEGGLNPWGGYPFMWHSHNERELTNYNIFPGGLLTMLIIVPPGTPIQ